MLRILIEDSEGKSKVAPIDPESGDVTIGRKEGNFIRLKERNVSRQHARIYMSSDGLFIEPVAARYGLKLNSKKIDGATPLELGDEIRIGDYRLYIQDENQPIINPNDNPDVVVDIQPEEQPRLVVVSSNFAGREYHIARSKVIIGRNPTCDIQIGHASVSGEHAEIRRNGRGDFEIRDLKSSNGTKVNNFDVSEVYRLNSGDVVMLGHVYMRYCAPGDFWSLNFGINDEPKRNTAVLLVSTILIVILAVLATVIVMNMMLGNQGEGQPQTIVDDTAKKDADFLGHIMSCTGEIEKANFEAAREHCDKAGSIYPSDTRYTLAVDKLEREESAHRAVDDIKQNIQDGLCRDALDAISNVKEDTIAFKTILVEDLKGQANECLAKIIYNRAMKSIENGDFDDAEMASEEIKSINPGSQYIGEIKEEIRRKRPRTGGGGGGSKSGSKAAAGGEAAPVEAPKPAAVNVDELCKQAATAKVKEKDNCKAYKLYKKAFAAGGANAACTRVGEAHVKQYEGQCK